MRPTLVDLLERLQHHEPAGLPEALAKGLREAARQVHSHELGNWTASYLDFVRLERGDRLDEAWQNLVAALPIVSKIEHAALAAASMAAAWSTAPFGGEAPSFRPVAQWILTEAARELAREGRPVLPDEVPRAFDDVLHALGTSPFSWVAIAEALKPVFKLDSSPDLETTLSMILSALSFWDAVRSGGDRIPMLQAAAKLALAALPILEDRLVRVPSWVNSARFMGLREALTLVAGGTILSLHAFLAELDNCLVHDDPLIGRWRPIVWAVVELLEDIRSDVGVHLYRLDEFGAAILGGTSRSPISSFLRQHPLPMRRLMQEFVRRNPNSARFRRLLAPEGLRATRRISNRNEAALVLLGIGSSLEPAIMKPLRKTGSFGRVEIIAGLQVALATDKFRRLVDYVLGEIVSAAEVADVMVAITKCVLGASTLGEAWKAFAALLSQLSVRAGAGPLPVRSISSLLAGVLDALVGKRTLRQVADSLADAVQADSSISGSEWNDVLTLMHVPIRRLAEVLAGSCATISPNSNQVLALLPRLRPGASRFAMLTVPIAAELVACLVRGPTHLHAAAPLIPYFLVERRRDAEGKGSADGIDEQNVDQWPISVSRCLSGRTTVEAMGHALWSLAWRPKKGGTIPAGRQLAIEAIFAAIGLAPTDQVISEWTNAKEVDELSDLFTEALLPAAMGLANGERPLVDPIWAGMTDSTEAALFLRLALYEFDKTNEYGPQLADEIARFGTTARPASRRLHDLAAATRKALLGGARLVAAASTSLSASTPPAIEPRRRNEAEYRLTWGSHSHLEPPLETKRRISRVGSLPWVVEIRSERLDGSVTRPRVIESQSTYDVIRIQLPKGDGSNIFAVRTTATNEEEGALIRRYVENALR